MTAPRTARGWMGKRSHCANGHDLTDPENLYPDLAGFPADRKWRRCRSCAKELNDLRRQAYTLLGLSQREYLAAYGSTKAAAIEAIAKFEEAAS